MMIMIIMVIIYDDYDDIWWWGVSHAGGGEPSVQFHPRPAFESQDGTNRLLGGQLGHHPHHQDHDVHDDHDDVQDGENFCLEVIINQGIMITMTYDNIDDEWQWWWRW